MIVAMACGTPVVAMRNGSVPEVIDDKVTGFIVEDEDQAVAAARQLHTLDPLRCGGFSRSASPRVAWRRIISASIADSSPASGRWSLRCDDMTASVPSANEPVSPFYIPASAAIGIARANVLKHGDCFAILDLFGNAQATGPAAEGLFFEDTRYLSQLALTMDGMLPLLLSSSVSENNDILEADLTNPDLIENGQLRSPRDTVHILSRTTLGDAALLARLELRNFALTPARFRLAVHVDADFVDSSSCAARCGGGVAACCAPSRRMTASSSPISAATG